MHSNDNDIINKRFFDTFDLLLDRQIQFYWRVTTCAPVKRPTIKTIIYWRINKIFEIRNKIINDHFSTLLQKKTESLDSVWLWEMAQTGTTVNHVDASTTERSDLTENYILHVRRR